MIHAGVLLSIFSGDVHMDSYGNVFAGNSWIGHCEGDLNSFLRSKVREYFREHCNNPVVLSFSNGSLVIDGRGRLFFMGEEEFRRIL